jgi:predicted O-linked N-acetylglucosamine transferase (SPINDLY family)
VRVQHIIKAVELDPTGYQTHLEVGAELFSLGSWDSALGKITTILYARVIKPQLFGRCFNNLIFKILIFVVVCFVLCFVAMFEKSFMLNNTCWQSLASLIFLRCHVCKWGNFGSQYELDMQGIEQIIQEEIALKDSQKQIMVQAPVLYSSGQGESLVPVSETTEWVEVNEASMTSSSIHTHMLLSYAIPSELKLQVARMHTEHEQSLVRRSGLPIYSHSPDMYAEAATSPSFRIKVGYVSANFKSKTTVYMAQDLFRFHDRSKFEVHAYATTPNDNPMFLATAMGGVDWRQKVRNGVDYFHEVNGKTVKQVADLIRSHGIHILVDWDGHSNNMIRLSGLFAMQPAPIQVGHQEFIGSSGASYMQYIITDKITSPSSLQHLYSEKFIYMPNTFLANSMAYLAPHIMPPVLRRDTDVYSRQLTQGGRDSDGSGTSQAVGDNEGIVVTEKKKSRNKKKANDNGQNVHNGDPLPNNPQFNGCGGPPADFVYCNFNKHLKFSPDVFRSWLTILQVGCLCINLLLSLILIRYSFAECGQFSPLSFT